MRRIIYLTKEGALAFRSNFYIKESQKEQSLQTAYLIQEKELRQKKYWIFVEIAKYIMGGIVGALIALGVKHIDKSMESKAGNSTTIKRDTATAYTKKDTL